MATEMPIAGQTSLAEELLKLLTDDSPAWIAAELEVLLGRQERLMHNPRWRQAITAAIQLATDVDGLRSAYRETAATK